MTAFRSFEYVLARLPALKARVRKLVEQSEKPDRIVSPSDLELVLEGLENIETFLVPEILAHLEAERYLALASGWKETGE